MKMLVVYSLAVKRGTVWEPGSPGCWHIICSTVFTSCGASPPLRPTVASTGLCTFQRAGSIVDAPPGHQLGFVNRSEVDTKGLSLDSVTQIRSG